MTVKVLSTKLETSLIVKTAKIQFGSFPLIEYKDTAAALVCDFERGGEVPMIQTHPDKTSIKMPAFQSAATRPSGSSIEIASKHNFRTIYMYHPDPYRTSRKIKSVQIVNAYYVGYGKESKIKKHAAQKKKMQQKPMTKSIKRNARRTQQRAFRRANSSQPQTINQLFLMVTTSNSFEVLHGIKIDVKTQSSNNKKPVLEQLGAPKRSIHERLGSSTQSRGMSVHQRLGSKKPSVSQRLGL